MSQIIANVGSGVERKNGDSRGRTGNIMEIAGDRIRVQWMIEANGDPITNGSGGFSVRTWVKAGELKALAEPLNYQQQYEAWRWFKIGR